jgi:hypothetical protein
MAILRTNKFRLALGLALTGCLFSVGCSSTPSSSTKSSVAQPGTPQTQPAPAKNASAEARQSLKNTGEYAEDIYDAAHATNWKLASAKSMRLADSSSKLPSGLQPAPELSEIESRVSALKKDIAAKNRLSTMSDANEITRLAADLSAGFRSKVPVQVAKLDYLGRKLQIESTQGNLSSLKQTTSEIRSNWNDVKTALEHRHPTTANNFEAIVSKLESAKGVSSFAKLAKEELDEVDQLENAFTS